jgi:hypothetical protein
MQIEVCRVLKQDEEVIYHAILKKLKPEMDRSKN